MLVAAAISATPSPRLRRTLYRRVLGYSIDDSAQVAMFALLSVEHARIGPRARVGRFTRMSGPFELEMDEGARIGPGNVVACGSFASDERRSGFRRTCRFGKDTLVTAAHYIDVSGGFELGDQSWLAGRGTQVWTHGAGHGGQAVSIGPRTYVGAAARFAPGSSVGPDSVVALGAVVTRPFEEPGVVLGGVPARVVKSAEQGTGRP